MDATRQKEAETASLILLQRYKIIPRKTNFLSIICTENQNFFAAVKH
jgi:hypothetical protein